MTALQLPYFRAYTPRVMHFLACHKMLCGLYEGAGYTKSFLHYIMYHLSCGVNVHNTDNRKSVLLILLTLFTTDNAGYRLVS